MSEQQAQSTDMEALADNAANPVARYRATLATTGIHPVVADGMTARFAAGLIAASLNEGSEQVVCTDDGGAGESPVTFYDIGYALGGLFTELPEAECECDIEIDLAGLGAAVGAEVAAYYAALVAGGMDAGNAELLADDVHHRLWDIALGDDEPANAPVQYTNHVNFDGPKLDGDAFAAFFADRIQVQGR